VSTKKKAPKKAQDWKKAPKKKASKKPAKKIRKPVTLLGWECAYDEEIGAFVGRFSTAELRAYKESTTWRVELLPTGLSMGKETLRFSAEGPTLQEAEAAAVAQMNAAMRMMSILNIYAGAPAEVAGAVSTFIETWEKLPPLVRASWADNTIQRLHASLRGRLNWKGLWDRRRKVHELFSVADSAWFVLMTALGTSADAEAERAGIDQDTRYGGWQPEVPRDREGEATIWESLSDSIADDVHRSIEKEVLASFVALAGDK
jgi:hypothetical protein